jgi:hypothetical protein
MTTKEVKLMIIENFIDYYTTNESERLMLKNSASDYVEEDWVDEIAQANIEWTRNAFSLFTPKSR